MAARWIGNTVVGLLCFYTLLSCIARWLRYEIVAGPSLLQGALGGILQAQYLVDMWGMFYFLDVGLPLFGLTAIGLIAGTWQFIIWLFQNRKSTQPDAMPLWVHVLFYAALIFLNPLLTPLPEFDTFFWLTLPILLSVTKFLSARDCQKWKVAILKGAVPSAAIAFFSLDTGSAVAMVVWWMSCLWIWRNSDAMKLDRLTITLGILLVINMFFCFWVRTPPADLIVHQDPGGAYDFCQVPGQNLVYSSGTIQHLTPNPGAYPEAKLTRYKWFDTENTVTVNSFSAFDDDLWGTRIGRPVCDERFLYLPVGEPSFYDRRSIIGILRFQFNDSGISDKSVISQNTGTFIAFDPFERQLYSTSELNSVVERIDVDSGQQILFSSENRPDLFQHFSSIDTQKRALDRINRSLFVADSFTGGKVHELSLPELEHLRSIDINQGANTDVMIDETSSRLFVAGVFGFTVVDLESNMIVARLRTGLAPRLVWTLPEQDLLLVGMTFGRGIYLYRLSDLKLLGIMPISPNTRYSVVSEDLRYLFTASGHTKFVVDSQKLIDLIVQ